MLTQFPNQTSIYTPTAAYVTHLYGTSPRQEYLLEFTSEYGISEDLHPKLPGIGERIMDFPEGKNNRFFWVDERVFPTVVDWRTSAPKDEMPADNTYSLKAMMVLNTHRTPIQKQLEALLYLVGLSRRYYLGYEVYPTFLHDDNRDMDLFNLIRAPNPTKVKTGTCPHAAHEVPLLTATASRVIEMEDPAAATVSSGVPSTIERVYINAPPKVLRIYHVDSRPTQSTLGGKSLAAVGLGMGSTCPVPTSRDAPMDIFQGAEDLESKNTSFTSMVGSPKSIYRPEWGMTNGYLLDAPEACQDLVDHIVPPGYFSELRHLHNDDFLKQYNINLARQVAMGSQLRLRFEQEAKLLKKSEAQVARRDKRIQARENEIKNLETLLEAETDMKKTTKGKSAELGKELENLRALFSDLQRCAEMDARLDALSIDFDEELYSHMLTAIVSRRWVIGHGLRLVVMKCGESTELRQVFADVVSARIAKGMSEGLKYGVEHGKANLSLEAIEAYDLEAEAKYITALHALKDLQYPMVDQLESLNDAPIDVIMASLHLESDTGDDAPQWICELRLSSSQLKIPVYSEVRDPTDPWSCKEEILLADAIAANVSHAKKKNKYRVVCRTHGVGSAHHVRSDGVPVSLPTIAPQGLAILLADAATQTETSEDGASSMLLRSSSLPAMHN
nr:hypothetical protein [Tanacetum cinerariifolium]